MKRSDATFSSEKFWKVAWDSAPLPVESECFIDPEGFDTLTLPGILRRIELCKIQQNVHEEKNAQLVQSNEPVTKSGPKKKKKKKKKQKGSGQALHSSMTVSEHRMYIQLLNIFGGKICTDVSKEEKAQIEMLALLHGRVVQEQQASNQHLRETAVSRKHLYDSLNPEAHRHLQARLKRNLEFLLKIYPPSYNIDRVLPLVTSRKEPKVNAMTLQHKLLELGNSTPIYLPELDAGHKIFLPLDPGIVDQRFLTPRCEHPSIKLISSDSFAIQLAEKYSANIVCTSSALQTILTAFIPPFDRNWELPLHFRENTDYPALFIDKPITQGQSSSRNRSTLFHKYAARIRLAKKHPFTNKNFKPASVSGVTELNPSKKRKISASRTRSIETMDTDLFASSNDICRLEKFGTFQNTTKVLPTKKHLALDTPEATKKKVQKLSTESTLSGSTNLSTTDPLGESTNDCENRETISKGQGVIPDTPESPDKFSTHNNQTEVTFLTPKIPLHKVRNISETTTDVDQIISKSLNNILHVQSDVSTGEQNCDTLVEDKTSGDDRIVIASEEINPLNEQAALNSATSCSDSESLVIDETVLDKEDNHLPNLGKSSDNEELNRNEEKELVHDSTYDSDTLIIDETMKKNDIVSDEKEKNENCSSENQAQENTEFEEDPSTFEALTEPYIEVSYNLLRLGDIALLVRHKIDGRHQGKPILICPKMQYLSNLGLEENSAQELVEQWVRLLIEPNATLVRVHVDAATSQVLMIQEVNSVEQLLSGCNNNKFNPPRFLDQLHQMLSPLTSLKPGQYLLTHRARESVAHLYTHSSKRCGFDLHEELQQRLHNVNEGNIKNNEICFLPLDPETTLPTLQGFRVPGLFPPRHEGQITDLDGDNR